MIKRFENIWKTPKPKKHQEISTAEFFIDFFLVLFGSLVEVLRILSFSSSVYRSASSGDFTLLRDMVPVSQVLEQRVYLLQPQPDLQDLQGCTVRPLWTAIISASVLLTCVVAKPHAPRHQGRSFGAHAVNVIYIDLLNVSLVQQSL